MSNEPDSARSSGTGGLQQAWDNVRRSFQSSIMVNTSLNSLAQNLDSADWPLEGGDETPAKYVFLSYDELSASPGLAGHPERIEQLITILRETLAFDEPFGEMIASGGEDKDNPILKNLAKLGIPENFPLSLVALLPETRDYCNLENLTTLREFAIFAQNLSQSVIVTGDFRSFLNALSHLDEATLSMYLPFRPGRKGLHLLEGIALTVRAQTNEVQSALAQRYGARLGSSDAALAAQASSLETAAIDQLLVQQAGAYVEYFQTDLASLQQQINDGMPLSRLAAEMKDPLVETVVTGLLKPYLTLLPEHAPTRTTAPPVEAEAPRKKGVFAALGRLFKK